MATILPPSRTGIPFGVNNTQFGRASMSINVPNINIPNDDDNNDDNNDDEPTTGEPNEKDTDPTEPKSPGDDDPDIWGDLGEIGTGILGAAKSIGSGAAKELPSAGDDVIEGVVHSPVGTATKAVTQGASKVLNGDEFGVLMRDAGSIGSGAAEGAETLAPVAGATEAIGGGPEDPIADIGAGAEEVGGALGGGLAALTRFF